MRLRAKQHVIDPELECGPVVSELRELRVQSLCRDTEHTGKFRTLAYFHQTTQELLSLWCGTDLVGREKNSYEILVSEPQS